MQYGVRRDNVGVYLSADALSESGWREQSPRGRALLRRLGMETRRHRAPSGGQRRVRTSSASSVRRQCNCWRELPFGVHLSADHSTTTCKCWRSTEHEAGREYGRPKAICTADIFGRGTPTATAATLNSAVRVPRIRDSCVSRMMDFLFPRAEDAGLSRSVRGSESAGQDDSI